MRVNFCVRALLNDADIARLIASFLSRVTDSPHLSGPFFFFQRTDRSHLRDVTITHPFAMLSRIA